MLTLRLLCTLDACSRMCHCADTQTDAPKHHLFNRGFGVRMALLDQPHDWGGCLRCMALETQHSTLPMQWPSTSDKGRHSRLWGGGGVVLRLLSCSNVWVAGQCERHAVNARAKPGRSRQARVRARGPEEATAASLKSPQLGNDHACADCQASSHFAQCHGTACLGVAQHEWGGLGSRHMHHHHPAAGFSETFRKALRAYTQSPGCPSRVCRVQTNPISKYT